MATASGQVTGRRVLDRQALLWLGLLVYAAIIRVTPMAIEVARTGQIQPYHSGGLFFAFVDAIKNNGFALPEQIPFYTVGGLPFVYPPLPFYLGALVVLLTGGGTATVLVINSVLSVLSVLAFIRLAGTAGLRGPGKFVAVLAFATIPTLYVEHLQGAGLAEAAGTLSIIFLLDALLCYGREPNWPRALWLGALLGLNVLASPGSALIAPFTFAFGLGYYALARWRTLAWRTYLLQTLGAGVVSLLLATPYVVHLLRELGLPGLIDALTFQETTRASLRGLADRAWKALWPSAASAVTFWNVLALVGLVYVPFTRRLFWPLYTLMLAVTPREGQWMIAIPAAVLCGEVVHGSLRGGEWLRGRYGVAPVHAGVLAAYGLLAGLLFYTAFYFPFDRFARNVPNNMFDIAGYVTPEEATTIDHLRLHTPADATFVIVGDEIEWAPFLLQRTVTNVSFGAEWVPPKKVAAWEVRNRLRKLHTVDEVVAMFYALEREFPDYLPVPDYLYVSEYEAGDYSLTIDPRIVESMRADPRFGVAYETPAAVVFEVNLPPSP